MSRTSKRFEARKLLAGLRGSVKQRLALAANRGRGAEARPARPIPSLPPLPSASTSIGWCSATGCARGREAWRRDR